jgi:hypothetical protein
MAGPGAVDLNAGLEFRLPGSYFSGRNSIISLIPTNVKNYDNYG